MSALLRGCDGHGHTAGLVTDPAPHGSQAKFCDSKLTARPQRKLPARRFRETASLESSLRRLAAPLRADIPRSDVPAHAITWRHQLTLRDAARSWRRPTGEDRNDVGLPYDGPADSGRVHATLPVHRCRRAGKQCPAGPTSRVLEEPALPDVSNLIFSPESCDAAGLPQDLKIKSLEIRPFFLMLLHHLAFTTNTIQAPSQESFPEDGGGVAFNGITPMFLSLRWKRFSR